MEKSCSILLDTSSFSGLKSYMLFDEEESIKILPNFNTINIFVGSNNSGKSRFMRTLMKQQKLKGINSLKEILEKANRHNHLVKKLDIHWRKSHRTYYPDTPSSLVSNTGALHIDPVEFNYSQYFSEKDSIITTFKNQIHHLEIAETFLKQDFIKHYERSNTFTDIIYPENFESDLAEAINLAKYMVENYEVQNLGTSLNYYIPTLRSAHSLFEMKDSVQIEYAKLKKDVFLDTLLKNYDFGNYLSYSPRIPKDGETEIKKIYIFTGLKLYNEIVNARNGSKSQRKDFEQFEKFVGKQFFNTESIDIVAQFNINEKHQNRDDNEIINISIEASDGKHLYDLGDGIQSLIILMYSIFMAPDDTIIYIDEPELNLHPGMQRLFLDQITGNNDLLNKNLTYVIATHSNHLLDLTIEKNNISIYSFSENGKDKFTIKNVNVGDNELLRQLGVNNSSVFLANSSIWVEGISDRNYIKAFLIAYCNKEPDKKFPKEDIDFAFLEYAGSNLSHYDFSKEKNDTIKAFALNNRIFILADNDDKKEEKHQFYKELCEQNSDNLEYCSTSPFREIENLLSKDVWKNVLIDLCNKKKVSTNNDEILIAVRSL